MNEAHREAIKKWQKAHPEKMIEYQKKYNATTEAKKKREAWIEKNREKISEYQKRYHRELRTKLKNQKICQTCQKKPAETNYTMCQDCREYTKQYRQKLKENAKQLERVAYG